MDRREALKKLGVGGAVAVSAPILLDSFNVASASSTALPPQNNDILSSVTNNGNAGIAIVLDTTQFPADTSFTWQVTLQTGNPATSVTPTTGSTVVVDKPPANQGPGNFTVVMTATSASSSPTSLQYNMVWNGTQLVVT
jgi:hypothetical protein